MITWNLARYICLNTHPRIYYARNYYICLPRPSSVLETRRAQSKCAPGRILIVCLCANINRGGRRCWFLRAARYNMLMGAMREASRAHTSGTHKWKCIVGTYSICINARMRENQEANVWKGENIEIVTRAHLNCREIMHSRYNSHGTQVNAYIYNRIRTHTACGVLCVVVLRWTRAPSQ